MAEEVKKDKVENKTKTEESLKIPTSADAEKKRQEESDALMPKEFPIEIGNKIIWVEELTMGNRMKLQKVYIRILKQGHKLYQQYTNPTDANTEKLMDAIEKDLESMTKDDMDFLMFALSPNNPELKREDLMEIKPSHMRILFDKILEVNGMADVLKKVLPSS